MYITYNAEKTEIHTIKQCVVAALCCSAKFIDSEQIKSAGLLHVVSEKNFLRQKHIRMETNV